MKQDVGYLWFRFRYRKTALLVITLVLLGIGTVVYAQQGQQPRR